MKVVRTAFVVCTCHGTSLLRHIFALPDYPWHNPWNEKRFDNQVHVLPRQKCQHCLLQAVHTNLETVHPRSLTNFFALSHVGHHYHHVLWDFGADALNVQICQYMHTNTLSIFIHNKNNCIILHLYMLISYIDICQTIIYIYNCMYLCINLITSKHTHTQFTSKKQNMISES